MYNKARSGTLNENPASPSQAGSHGQAGSRTVGHQSPHAGGLRAGPAQTPRLHSQGTTRTARHRLGGQASGAIGFDCPATSRTYCSGSSQSLAAASVSPSFRSCADRLKGALGLQDRSGSGVICPASQPLTLAAGFAQQASGLSPLGDEASIVTIRLHSIVGLLQ